MQNDGEFLIGDYEESNSSDLELVIDKANKNENEHKEDVLESQNILDYDIEGFVDKPWNKPGADITDYFNYGFNETTWREYCSMQKRKNEFTSGSSEWIEGKYNGVRRGFNEIKKEDRDRRDGNSKRNDKRGFNEGQRWDSWQGRREDRVQRRGGDKEDKKRYGEKEDGNTRRSYRNMGK